jgi:hypothetical protein
LDAPGDKNLSDLNHGMEQTILSVNLALSIVPEKHSRIPKQKKKYDGAVSCMSHV